MDADEDWLMGWGAEGEGQEVSLDEFLAEEASDFSQITHRIDKSFESFMQEKLTVLGMAEDEEDLQELVNGLLHDGEELHENSEVDSEDVQEVNMAARNYAKLYDRGLFFLVAPRDNLNEVTLKEDIKARKRQ